MNFDPAMPDKYAKLPRIKKDVENIPWAMQYKNYNQLLGAFKIIVLTQTADKCVTNEFETCDRCGHSHMRATFMLG